MKESLSISGYGIFDYLRRQNRERESIFFRGGGGGEIGAVIRCKYSVNKISAGRCVV